MRLHMAKACLWPIFVPCLTGPGSSQEQVIVGHEVEKIIVPDGKFADRFGRGVSVSGDRLLATSLEDSGAGSPNTVKGSAYAYSRSPSGWVFDEEFGAPDGDEFDQFGWSAVLDGETALIGALTDDNQNGVDAGSAYVFRRTPSGWKPQGKLLASQGSQGAWFGWAVDLDGDTAIVGTPREPAGGVFFQGAAYVYVRNPDGTWVEQARLLGDPLGSSLLGADVAIRGDTAFASASGEAAVYVFERSGTTWTRLQRITAPVPVPSYGEEIDFDGSTLWVSSVADMTAGQSTGAAFSYVHDGSAWVEEQKILSADPFDFERFGWQVDVQGEWGVISVRALQSGENPGTVHILHRQQGTWTEVGTFSASDDYMGLDFATEVSFDGATVVSGAHGFGIGNAVLGPSGAVYVHVLDLPPVAHCTAESRQEGCAGTMTWTGDASLSDPTPFDVGATGVATESRGLFFYGSSGALELPYGSGTLCVQPPLRRTPIQTSGQSVLACDGRYSFDFNAWIQSGQEPLAAPGLRVDGQYWFRDASDPSGVGLTDAVTFFIDP